MHGQAMSLPDLVDQLRLLKVWAGVQIRPNLTRAGDRRPTLDDISQVGRALPGTGETVNGVKTIGVVAATLAVMLLGAQPVAAAPTEAAAAAATSTPRAAGGAGRAAFTQVSCRVTTRWTCVTPSLNTFGSTIFHLSTQGIPNLAPAGQPSSFVIVRDVAVAGHPEVLREYRYGGAEHDHWRDRVYSTYRAELHCPYTCQGASLYFANG
jgi:hypothetical protein